MLHRKVKDGDRFVLKRGDDTIIVFLRSINPVDKTAMVSLSADRAWSIEHCHPDKLGGSDLTETHLSR
jgi:hypothetical protein